LEKLMTEPIGNPFGEIFLRKSILIIYCKSYWGNQFGNCILHPMENLKGSLLGIL
jgi:hypothetical protein